jgi:tetratricopeptide (TPR) repeat protein
MRQKAAPHQAVAARPSPAGARVTEGRLAEAMALHRAGRLAEAAAQYRALLRQQPRNSDAQNLLGLVLFQQQDFPAAVAALRQAMRLRSAADYARNLGMALRAAGRLPEAIAAYRQALALQPGVPETQFNLGNALGESGQHAAAAEALRAAIALRPDYGAAWQNLGGALLALGQPEEAVPAFEAATRHRPEDAQAPYSLGLALERLGRWPEAEAAFRTALARGAAQPEVPLHLGQALQEQERWPEAAAAFRSVLAARPDHAPAWLGLGVALQAQEALEEAAEAFAAAARCRPDYREAHYNLAGVRRQQARLPEAEAALRAALALEPEDADALNNLGNLLNELGWPEEALELCRRARALAPEDPIPRTNCARQLLTLGHYAEGWDLFECRWRAGETRYDFGLPEWDGTPLPEGRILVWREQGVGDEVMYASLLPELLAAGHRLTLLCDPRLEPVYARSFPGVEFHRSGDPGHALRAQIAIGSLPRLLRRREADFAGAAPYLKPDPQLRAALRARYGEDRPLIGLAWHTINQKTTARRSIPLRQLGGLLSRAGLRWVSLQYGPHDSLEAEAAGLPLLIDRGIDPIRGIDAPLAQIAAMDLVVSIDNSTVHFAASMGVPCWAMLPFCADWRWLCGREDSPWYPGLRLFRQAHRGRWEPVLEAVAEALAQRFPAPEAALLPNT